MSATATGPMPALYNLDAEIEVLGSVFRRPEKIADLLPIVSEDDFFDPRCKGIFAAQVELSATGTPITFVTVGEALKAKRLLDAETVKLIGQANDLAHAEGAAHAASIVREYSKRRELYWAAHELARNVAGNVGPPDELLAAHEQRLAGIRRHAKQSDLHEPHELASQFVDEITRRRAGRSLGVPSGFCDLDRDLGGGFWSGQLIILAARTSVGKSSLAWQFATSAAERSGKPALFASAEMPPIELIEREFARQSRVDSNVLRNGQLSTDESRALTAAFDGVAGCGVIVGDARGASMSTIRSQARRVIMRHESPSLLVVDYLQFIQPDDSRANRNEQVAAISRSLKALAAECRCPIVALSQLNRQAEHREGHKPRLSDLRDSGAIEQDADVVLLLFRPEIHNSGDRPGEADLIIAKNRGGPLGEIKLTFIKQQTRFANYFPAFETGANVGHRGGF